MSEVLARNSDPVTSHTAAAEFKPRARPIKARVFMIFEEFPAGLTDEELTAHYMWAEAQMGWQPVRFDTPRKRRSDLSAAGFLVPTGEIRRGQQVWAVNA